MLDAQLYLEALLSRGRDRGRIDMSSEKKQVPGKRRERPLGWRKLGWGMVPLLLLVARMANATTISDIQRMLVATPTVVPDDWTTYMAGIERSGFNKNETTINPATAPQLQLYWSVKAAATIFSQPIVANGMIYWGSWDGFEHATDLSGKQVWKDDLGTSRTACTNDVGVLNTATVAPVVIEGTSTSVVFIGGGNGHLYALNAATGATIWSTALGSSPDNFLWSSPILYNGSVYEGVSSIGDCPLIQGKLVQLDAATGKITHTFDTVPNGCVGASIWGSPTIDAADDSIYFATGNGGPCSRNEPYAEALVKLRTANLSFLDAWSVPQSARMSDGDFGSTPTLFKATIGGMVRHMVGLVNKNGYYYAFDRTAIGHGPVWQRVIGGQNTIAPSAWDGTHLYVGGQEVTINGKKCAGSVKALNPATGGPVWEHCLGNGAVTGAVTLAPGIVVVSEGLSVLVLATANGRTLFRYTSRTEHFLGPASIANGVLYIGSEKGTLYAFGL